MPSDAERERLISDEMAMNLIGRPAGRPAAAPDSRRLTCPAAKVLKDKPDDQQVAARAGGQLVSRPAETSNIRAWQKWKSSYLSRPILARRRSPRLCSNAHLHSPSYISLPPATCKLTCSSVCRVNLLSRNSPPPCRPPPPGD